ncbi:U32 family peptidase [Inconstantimicrobium porci]|uniref:U32 family peptidase n=1 Tax=Inconstantimicrobium porci TaxID=2652291 RepID=A0A7X2SZY5_9CLOT|nr:U32 family peptidase [Inconstantimicrobium porci]MSR89987.1 U32 family peptidase [Inconstantimicrobium porci]
MNDIELLAPAGSIESLYAAVLNGADAVYLGGSKFSARAYASNFDDENMEKAVDYAHSYGVKIYVTINTLMKENEIDEAVSYARFLYKIGVDAILVQDTGLFKMLKDSIEGVELHASTQLTVHNGEGAKFFKDAGFHRIVLSRELSLKEIEYISKELDIETEIFVHGALCVSYSGQCLMSSMIGGRSGNRGRCAQSCRLPYTLEAQKSKQIHKGYLLSPKDISGYNILKDLLKTGTSSLKIEGRMKRPEYVAGVVSEYRNAIDSLKKNKSIDYIRGDKTLLKLFNREGFSSAFFYKNTGRDMMAYNMPKNSGIKIGTVAKNEVKLTENLSKGDGIRYSNEKGFTVSKILINNNEVIHAQAGDTVKIFPKQYKNGDVLYKTSDNELNSSLKETFSDKYKRKIFLNAKVIFKVGSPLTISTEYNGKEYKAEGKIVENAINKPLSMEKVNDNLLKSVDNPYKFSKINYDFFEDGFLPISAINEVRREILEEINSYEIKKHKRIIKKPAIRQLEPKVKTEEEIYYIAYSKDQLNALLDNNANNVVVDIWSHDLDSITVEDFKIINNINIYIKVPNIIKQEFNSICKIIDNVLPFIKGIYTANVGIVNKYKGKTQLIGDYKLNIMNSKALEFYSDYYNIPVLSEELTRKEIKDICKKVNCDIGYTIYGRTELMINEYCVIGSIAGGKSTNVPCNRACERDKFILIDRMNEKFPVKTDKFCRARIYNSVPLNLIREKEELESFGINKFFIEFTNENYSECENIINWVCSGVEVDDEYTKGHYRRGVE